MAEEIQLAALQEALERRMREHPPQGLERVMHPDAQLSTLWATKLVEHTNRVAEAKVHPQVLDAYRRWA